VYHNITIKTGDKWKFRLTQLKVFTATSKFTAKVQKHEPNKTQRSYKDLQNAILRSRNNATTVKRRFQFSLK